MSVDMPGTTIHIWIPADTNADEYALELFFEFVADAATEAALRAGWDAHISSVHIAAPVSAPTSPEDGKGATNE